MRDVCAAAGDGEDGALDTASRLCARRCLSQARPLPYALWCFTLLKRRPQSSHAALPTVLKRRPQSSHAALPTASTRAARPAQTQRVHTHSGAQHMQASISMQTGVGQSGARQHAAADVPAALAGAAAGLLPAATRVSAAAISASGTVDGSMLRAAVLLAGVRARCGALRHSAAAAECALRPLPPSSPYRVAFRMASSTYCSLRRQSKYY